MTLDDVLGRLQKVSRNGTGWKALCPAHADKNPSLSINERDGKVLLYCHAGCSQVAVLDALKGAVGRSSNVGQTSEGRKIVTEYDYRDEKGELLFQVVRFEPKDFRQRKPDGKGGWLWNLNGTRRVLYRLPEVLASKSVLVCEGEKDCETARALGFVATCNVGGAGKWVEEYSQYLKGKRITIIADADEPGRKHAQQVAASLFGKAEFLKLLEFPHAKDLTEWTAMGGKQDVLLEQIRNTPQWKPAAKIPAPSPQAGAVMRCVADIEPQPIRWLWPERIPLGKLTLFSGDPGLGKSLVTIDITARVTRGRSFPDGAKCEVGSVIVLSAEDDAADTIRPRLDAAGADVSRVHILQAVRRAKPNGETSLEHFSLKADLVALQDAAASLGDARLIIIDPVSAYLDGTDSHVNAKIRGLLSPLSEIASALGAAVVAVDHLSKKPGPAIYRSNGSIAFVAASRATWLFAKDADDPSRRLMLPGKMNLAREQDGLRYEVQVIKPGVVAVQWGESVSVSADIALQVESVEERSALLEAREWLRDKLGDGPVSAKRIQKDAAAAGIAWATIRRAKDALRVGHQKSSFSGGWEWVLEDAQHEDAHPPALEMSIFEESVEKKEVNPDVAHEDAHPPRVSIFDSQDDDGEVRL